MYVNVQTINDIGQKCPLALSHTYTLVSSKRKSIYGETKKKKTKSKKNVNRKTIARLRVTGYDRR